MAPPIGNRTNIPGLLEPFLYDSCSMVLDKVLMKDDTAERICSAVAQVLERDLQEHVLLRGLLISGGVYHLYRGISQSVTILKEQDIFKGKVFLKVVKNVVEVTLGAGAVWLAVVFSARDT